MSSRRLYRSEKISKAVFIKYSGGIGGEVKGSEYGICRSHSADGGCVYVTVACSSGSDRQSLAEGCAAVLVIGEGAVGLAELR